MRTSALHGPRATAAPSGRPPVRPPVQPTLRRGVLLGTLLAVLLAAGRPLRAEEPPALTPLAGVRAGVREPGAPYERTEDVPRAGQWRLLLRAPGSTLEARVFPVAAADDERSVLMQAADQASRLMRGDGFGLPSLRTFRLDGCAVAESDWWVTRGAVRFDGRIRLLRASPAVWALAWGLSAEDTPAAAREAAQQFARSLVPTEPTFHEPLPPAPDGEEVLAHPAGEEPLRRRHLDTALEILEQAARLRLPRAEREAVRALLLAEAQASAHAREGFRGMATQVSEARGLPAESQRVLRQSLGERMLQGLDRRANEGEPRAQELTLRITLARRPAAGSAEDGLTRWEAGTLLDAAGFLASLAADQALAGDAAPRERALAGLAARWEALGAEERAALRAAERSAADLPARCAAADPVQRTALRRAAVEALRPLPAGAVLPDDPLRALRARLDLAPADPGALLDAAAALAPAAWTRLLGTVDAAAR